MVGQATGQPSFSLDAEGDHVFSFSRAGLTLKFNPENDETAFLASIFKTETHTIFVKLSASTHGIAQLESQFLDFCKSFTLDTSQ